MNLSSAILLSHEQYKLGNIHTSYNILINCISQATDTDIINKIQSKINHIINNHINPFYYFYITNNYNINIYYIYLQEIIKYKHISLYGFTNNLQFLENIKNITFNLTNSNKPIYNYYFFNTHNLNKQINDSQINIIYFPNTILDLQYFNKDIIFPNKFGFDFYTFDKINIPIDYCEEYDFRKLNINPIFTFKQTMQNNKNILIDFINNEQIPPYVKIDFFFIHKETKYTCFTIYTFCNINLRQIINSKC